MKLATLALGLVACGVPAGGAYVSAPSGAGGAAGGAAAESSGAAGAQTEGPRSPPACRQSWALEDVPAGDARVLVVCGNDVRREPIVVGAMSRAIDPGLESAHDRVCSCASRMAAPQFVDLVVTAVPDEGRAGVETSEPEGELDPGVAAAFASCVGKIATSFPRFAGGACPGGDKTTFVYSFDIDLGR
ncbi:MAG TPA: hypothetical protein VMI75_27035 [Polyangiaceae bacterium]|nr:hypothetical protein [Polyangiaceae bacterium]